MIKKIKAVIENLRQTDSTPERKFVFAPHVRLLADELEEAIKCNQTVLFYRWGGHNYSLMVTAEPMILDSFTFTNNQLQVFMREKPKEENK